MRFSDDLSPYTNELPDFLAEALIQVKQYFKVNDLKVLSFDIANIAVPVTYQVSLPSRGAVNDIDIRPEEPVLIKFSLVDYPNRVPVIMSDRKDFPKNELPHLYASYIGDPAKLCLVRNSPNEWFASRQLKDLLLVGEQWFYKAGTGQLIEDGGEWDPTRLEYYRGYHIFKYEVLQDIVKNDQRFLPDIGMAILMSCTIKEGMKDQRNLTYKSLSGIPYLIIDKAKKDLESLQEQLKTHKSESDPLFSILVWDVDNCVDQQHFSDLPTNYGELKTYLKEKGVNIVQILKVYDGKGLHLKKGIPIVHAVRRPLKMIGYGGDYEFFNFVLHSPKGIKNLSNDALVIKQSHIEPFGQELAHKLSGEIRMSKTIYIGAGSLGSKMIVHDARTGKLHIAAVDADEMLQHNLVRHALFPNSIGQNKALAIVEEIKAFYPLDSTKNFIAYDKDVIHVLDAEMTEYNWLVDTSASTQVQNHLVLRRLPQKMNISRCEIVDGGALGLLYIEGENRNPRLDDLVGLTYFMATEDSDLAQWRTNDAKTEQTTLDVGLGCSSTTTVMADDIISNHSSIFSKVLADESDRERIKENGLIYLNLINDRNGFTETSSDAFVIKPFTVIPCYAKSGWEVRFKDGVTDLLLEQCNSYKPVETGGILIGTANYKTKVIHVFDVVTQTKTSRGTEVSFTRSSDGLPEIVNQIKKETGEVVGYVGEWHSHPMNLEGLSSTDLNTIKDLNKLNSLVPIPTCSLVVTKTKVLPFIFE